MNGPCTRARVVADGVLIPTSGIVQTAEILQLVRKAPEMRAELETIRNLTIRNLRTLSRKRDREAVAGDVIVRIDALLASLKGGA